MRKPHVLSGLANPLQSWFGRAFHTKVWPKFLRKGVKTSAVIYERMLKDVVEPLNYTPFEDIDNWCFKQDAAPAHKAKKIQIWLTANVPDFISTDDWPSGSPDLNPLDYALWNKLAERAYSSSYWTLQSLKDGIMKAARELPLATKWGYWWVAQTFAMLCAKGRGPLWIILMKMLSLHIFQYIVLISACHLVLLLGITNLNFNLFLLLTFQQDESNKNNARRQKREKKKKGRSEKKEFGGDNRRNQLY